MACPSTLYPAQAWTIPQPLLAFLQKQESSPLPGSPISLCVEISFSLDEAALLAASACVRVYAQVPPPSQGVAWHRCMAAKALTPELPVLCSPPLPAPGWCPFSMTHRLEDLLISDSLASS